MMMRMAFLDDYQNVALQMADWRRLADRIEFHAFNEHFADDDVLVDRLKDFDILFAMRERTALTAEILSRLPRLKLIVTAGPLNAAIDVRAARVLGKAVCGTGYSSRSTAEMTWSLILLSAYHTHAQIESVRAGGWQCATGRELHGKTLGVIGLGGVGEKVAQVGNAFGMNILAWSANLTEETAARAGVRLVPFETLMRSADIVTIHLRLSERTRDQVGALEIGWMKSSAWLINTSRGPIVNEAALIAALQEKRIGGAALDVFETEPLPSAHPFRTLPNVLATPHVGYVSDELYAIFFGDALDDVVAWLNGRVIRPVPDYRDVPASGLPDWAMA